MNEMERFVLEVVATALVTFVVGAGLMCWSTHRAQVRRVRRDAVVDARIFAVAQEARDAIDYMYDVMAAEEAAEDLVDDRIAAFIEGAP